MPTIKPYRSSITSTSEFFPIEVFLEDEYVPYSRMWRHVWWKEDSDIGSSWVGSGGSGGLDNLTIENHPIYARFISFRNRFKFERPNSVPQMLMEYAYPEVLQQVAYYNLPHNPSIEYEYDYFRHLSSLINVHEYPHLKEFLDRIVNFIDSVYETWPETYSHVKLWDSDKNVTQWDDGVVYGYGRQIANPPILHPVWNPEYVAAFGTRTQAYPVLTAIDLVYENDTPVPELEPHDEMMLEPEPIPEPVAVPVPAPTPDKDKDSDNKTTPTIEDNPVAEPVAIPPMPEPNRPVSASMRQRLEEYWVMYKLQTASINDQYLLAYYGIIDYGAIYTGKSRR